MLARLMGFLMTVTQACRKDTFNLKVMHHHPTKKDIKAFDKITYVISKQEDAWIFSVYFVNVSGVTNPLIGGAGQ